MFYLLYKLSLLKIKSQIIEYKFGILWWFLEPLGFVIIFYLINLSSFGGKGLGLEQIFIGKLIYSYFSKSINGAALSIYSNFGNFSINYPLSLYTWISHSVHFLQLIIGFLIFIFAGIFFDWLNYVNIIYTIICFFSISIVVQSLSLLNAILSALFRDFQSFVGLLTFMLLFLSGVFIDIVNFKPYVNEYLWFLLTINPIYLAISLMRYCTTDYSFITNLELCFWIFWNIFSVFILFLSYRNDDIIKKLMSKYSL